MLKKKSLNQILVTFNTAKKELKDFIVQQNHEIGENAKKIDILMTNSANKDKARTKAEKTLKNLELLLGDAK